MVIRMFRGVIPPIITPFNSEGGLDEAFLRSHVNYLIKCGVHGVFCLSSVGEFAYLSDEEKLRVMEVVVEEVAGRVPVLVGVGHFSCRVSVNYAKIAERLGADGLVAIILSYFPVTDDMAYEYYVSLAGSTSLPVLIYNFPAVTGFDIKPETVARLAEIENIVGIKDTVVDARHTLKILELAPSGFSVFPGSEITLQAAMEAGAKGMILGTSNITPTPSVEFYEAYRSGDIARARSLLPKVVNLLQIVSIAPVQYLPSIIKNAINLIGRPINTFVRKPLPSLSKEQLEKLKEKMVEIGLLEAPVNGS
ncbi:MAG: dihydrodipicolinate synthase family protein [Candidatus Freyarchaeota archaeon]|nr:dihydrodipicolinate synthase family protein [Candidatus Jordarchaeia archaeon]